MIISNLASRLLRPFANAGAKATIPVSQTDATRASYEQGFPALNMTPIAAGGVPPSGQDFNGVLYDLSNAALWQQAAGILPWDAGFAQSPVSGGYPKNALVVHNAMLYQSSVDNNTETPGAGTNWQGVGVSNASQTQHAVTLGHMQDALAQHTHPDATQTQRGFMSAADKQRLDGLNLAPYAPLLDPLFTKRDSDLHGGAIRLQAADNQVLGDIILDTHGNNFHIYSHRKSGGGIHGVYINMSRVGLNEWQDLLPPAGSILITAANSPPVGYLAANGAAVSRTAYANLFAAIGTTYGAGDGSTTFNLPDLRGEFIRGWDNGRGVDPWRAFGSWQGDAIRNITGTFEGNVNDGQGAKTGAFYYTGANYNGGDAAGGGGIIGFDASRVVPTANENRPRNVALLACIKY